MELQKSVIDFVIVTLPGVFLYFLGWVYLYYFLYFFGINISELKLDTSTVFIYSYSPIYDTMIHHLMAAGLTFTVILLAMLTTLFDKLLIWPFKWGSRVHRKWIGFRWPSSIHPSWRIVYITVIFLFFVLVMLNLVLIPIARSSASLAANQKWEGDTRSIVVSLN